MKKCQSFAVLVGNLYDEYNLVSKQVLAGAAGIAVAAKSGDPAAGLEVRQKSLDTLDKITEVVEKMEAKFSDVVGRTSNLTIGPRCLRLDRWERGTVVSSADRAFVTAAPLDTDTATLRIQERGGKGKVRVRVCSFDADGDHRDHRKFEVNEDRSEKRDKDQDFAIKLDGVENRWVSVILDGRSLSNRFAYRLMLDT